MTDTTIINARAFIDGALTECGIAIADGQIAHIGKELSLHPGTSFIDAHGTIILPGLVDLHVHFRDPGATHKEDFFTGSCAAIAGGVTSVLDEPNNIPVTDTPDALRSKLEIIKRKSLVDYSCSVALNAWNLNKLKEFRDLGAYCFAEFDELGDKPTGLTDAGILLEAMKRVKEEGGMVLLNCREAKIVDKAISEIRAAGKNSFNDYNDSFPNVAEAIASADRLLMAEDIGVKAHLREISTHETLRVIRCLKKSNISTEGRPDHLFLNKVDHAALGPLAEQWTPIRRPEDSHEMLEALNSGLIDVIASDHAPHTLEEKSLGYKNIWNSPPGIPAVETMLPLLLTEVNKGTLSLTRLVEATAINPAKILGIYPKKGCLQLGSDADLVLVDIKKERTIRGENLHGKTKWTPYEGWKTRGEPVLTFIRGILMYDEVIIGKPGQGKALHMMKSNTCDIK
jgi:dihydroorotase